MPVRVVVLAEDALSLRRRRGAHRREPDREIPQLVLRHQKREPKAFVVVLVPHPGPAHLRVGEVDRGSNERLDRLGDRRHQSGTTGTPAIVSEAALSTTAWRCPVAFHTRSWRAALLPSRATPSGHPT